MANEDKTTAVTTADKGTAAAVTDAGARTTTDKGAAATTSAAATTTTDKGVTTDATKGYWPEDWRARIAKGDEKTLKQVSRYQSPEAIWDKARALEQRLSSGELKAALPKDAKPEEISAWRKDNGIPEKADGYDVNDLKIGKEHKPVVDELLKMAHAANFTPDQARAGVEFYLSRQAAVREAVAAKDEKQRLETIDSLNVEWGSDFRRNINLVGNVLAKFPEKIRENLKSARMPDGTAIFNDPDVVKAFVALELMNNPVGIVAPSGDGEIGKSAMDEYKSIQKTMRENRKAYDKDAGMQARFTALIEYLQKNELIDGNGNETVQRKKVA